MFAAVSGGFGFYCWQ